jgi:hypothetical protein
MTQPSFAALKLELEDACAFLNSFTTGRQGYTRQDIIAGIGRVRAQCERLVDLFDGGQDSRAAEEAVALSKASIKSAEAHLDQLRR